VKQRVLTNSPLMNRPLDVISIGALNAGLIHDPPRNSAATGAGANLYKPKHGSWFPSNAVCFFFFR
jgi:hypothetical protein